MRIPDMYHRLIEWIGDGTGMSDTILHIHAGMAVLLLARVISRRSLGTFVPLSCVAFSELGNEVMDRLHFGSWRWPDTTSDIINTLFWPTVICLAVRIRPLLLRDFAPDMSTLRQ
ncbi:hypothetical protein [Sphingobium sp. CECT 9361]|uniref:hypothetical protein n=1 Tax=Sphingobium sp. CECT 9361 TaxID=2845384 RepID=UPI001E513718|nr:hypothetical protein [Sphingobium sp. CECT 9361]CAH0356445.1 hypothetical protein SPH9361_04089 [Sphingobium sp. CECT 9361]